MSPQPLTIESIWIFPLKSAKGVQVQQSGYTETGFDFDRQWMIVDARTRTFLTARTIGKMVLLEPSLDLAAHLLRIHVPSHGDTPASDHAVSLSPPTDPTSLEDGFEIWGSRLDGYIVGSAELTAALSSFMGKEVLLVMKGEALREAGPGVGWIEDNMKSIKNYEEPSSIKWNDQFPILLVTQQSYAAINDKIFGDASVRGMKGFDEARWAKEQAGIEVERFRGNIVVSGGEYKAWEEDGWAELEFEAATGEKETLFVAARCARCMLPNVSPATGVRDKVVPHSVLYPWRNVWSLMPEKTCFGVNICPRDTRGILRVGDAIKVTASYPQQPDGTFLRPEDVALNGEA